MLMPQAENAFVAERPFLTQAMRLLTGSVSVVTAGTGVDRTGATVTSAHSLSVEPEVMMVSINLQSSTFPIIERFRHFCVNVLGAHQHAVADRFAGRGGFKGPTRYEGAAWRPLSTGALALEGALASIDCLVEEIMPRHSHAIILGRVQAIALAGSAVSPLLYRNGSYGSYTATLVQGG